MFEVEQFWINTLTHAGSSCRSCCVELLQVIKALGSLGQNKLNKMHISTGYKSVICDQHVNPRAATLMASL